MAPLEVLTRWYVVKDQLKALKEEEQSLREQIFAEAFPTPVEGVNKCDLEGGYVLKGTYKLNRKIIREAYLEKWSSLKIPANIGTQLIKTDYSLMIGPYKKLTDDLRKKVDTILEIKPGLPTLEITSAKE